MTIIEWVTVYSLVLLVGGQASLATRYRDAAVCEAAGKAWAASAPHGGRGYMCLRNEFPIFGGQSGARDAPWTGEAP